MSYSCLSKGSIPTVGSSNIISLGLCNKQTPSDTLLLWPPLKRNNVKIKRLQKQINNYLKVHILYNFTTSHPTRIIMGQYEKI